MQANNSTYPTTSVPAPPRPAPLRTGPMQFLLFVAAMAWYLCARALAASAANGLSWHFNLGDYASLIEAVAAVFLIVLGFAVLRAIERRRAPLRLTLGLPGRPTSGAEWATGAAIGWGLAIAAVIPIAMARGLNVRLWTAPRAWELLAFNLVTLALLTLCETLAFVGYPWQRLIDAIGPTRATVFVTLLVGVARIFEGARSSAAPWVPIVFSMLGVLLLCLGWLRTHGLWLPWGLNFAWNASIAVVFGLPVQGSNAFSSVVESRTMAPRWLGGSAGAELSTLSPLLLLLAIPILVRATSDYAWKYTFPPIIPAGYDVTIPPPAAHVAMEAEAQARPINPASLVQILPATPQTRPQSDGPD